MDSGVLEWKSSVSVSSKCGDSVGGGGTSSFVYGRWSATGMLMTRRSVVLREDRVKVCMKGGGVEDDDDLDDQLVRDDSDDSSFILTGHDTLVVNTRH